MLAFDVSMISVSADNLTLVNAVHEKAAAAPLSMMFGHTYPTDGSNSDPPEFKVIDVAHPIVDMIFTLAEVNVAYVMLMEHPSLAGTSPF